MIFGRYDYAAFLTFMAYAVGSVGVPVALVQIARDLGFPLDEGGTTAGGWLHMVRSVAICASMAVCAFIAGRWGNRRPVGLSVALVGAGMLACAAAPSYAILIVALLIAGLGEGIIEGLATPFVQDLHKDEPGRYVNFTHGFWSLGVLAVTLIFGALLMKGVSWQILLGLAGVFAFIPAVLMLAPERRTIYPERKEKLSASRVAEQAKAIFKTRQFWIYFAAMFLAGGGEFCLTFWCASFIQLDLSMSAFAGGIGTAAFALGMFAGRTGFGFLMHQRHLKGLLIVTGIVATLTSLLIPWIARNATTIQAAAGANAAWMFPVLCIALFVSGIATAPFWPSIQTYAVERMPHLDSTMMFVLLSCAGIPGCGFFTLLMGYASREVGMTASFYIVPACFAVMVALLLSDPQRKRCD